MAVDINRRLRDEHDEGIDSREAATDTEGRIVWDRDNRESNIFKVWSYGE